MQPKFSNSIVRGRVLIATYGNKRSIPVVDRSEHTYHVKNLQTQYTLFSSNNYELALHIFYHIPKRKNGDIVLYNAETGEALKTKLKKNQ